MDAAGLHVDQVRLGEHLRVAETLAVHGGDVESCPGVALDLVALRGGEGVTSVRSVGDLSNTGETAAAVSRTPERGDSGETAAAVTRPTRLAVAAAMALSHQRCGRAQEGGGRWALGQYGHGPPPPWMIYDIHCLYCVLASVCVP